MTEDRLRPKKTVMAGNAHFEFHQPSRGGYQTAKLPKKASALVSQ
jgi:hypothetical protein